MDDTGNYLNDMKAMTVALRKAEGNMSMILDGFMKYGELRAFLAIHSVFRADARTSGEFIETYMLGRVRVSDDQIRRLFGKKIPDEIAKLLSPFEVEPIPFDVESYRVEFGCRKDPVTEKYQRDPIRVVDTTLEYDDKPIDTEKFLSQFEDIAL